MKQEEHFLQTCIKLGKHIQNLREERQISIREMSEKTGIRKEYLRKIELGKAYGVSLDRHLLKIAQTLNVKIIVLLDF